LLLPSQKVTNIGAMCCRFHLPQPGQSKDFQLCAMSKPSRLLDVNLNALKNVSMNGLESLQ